MSSKSYVIDFTDSARIDESLAQIYKDVAMFIGQECLIKKSDGGTRGSSSFEGSVSTTANVYASFDFVPEHERLLHCAELSDLGVYLHNLDDINESRRVFSGKVLVDVIVRVDFYFNYP